MSSRRIQPDASSVSLFPFLAVLLCTMGSLIVILVVLTRQVRATAAPAPQPPAVDERLAKQVAEERENLQWQIEHLGQSLAATSEQLQSDRLKLSNVEDAISRLRERIAQLDLTARELEKASHITTEQRQAAEVDLARLQQRVSDLATTVERERKELAQRPQSYSIIPYEGSNQTRRQPIFIECTAEAVIIQPEGIRLGADDFEEPLGPGNPLAAALRATREYQARARRSAGLPEQEPYPLIIVRPSGIAAYYGVRDAIKSWDSDFGYELIGEDWKLSYPLPDPGLRQVQERAVMEGRQYQTRLAAAAPSKYGRRPTVYRAAPHRGGLIREGGAGGNGGAMAGERSLAGNASRQAARGANASAGEQVHSVAGAGSHGNGDQSTSPSAASQRGNNPSGAPQTSAQASQATAGQMGTPGGAQAAAGLGTPQQQQRGFEHNGSNRRKSNWALPDANQQSVPITRSVRVLCRGDRYVIMPERGLEGGHVIMLKTRTEESIDEFVSKMWQHMKGWGIAGSGLYWRPVLVLQVLEGGEERARELALLLEDSGVEVRDGAQQ